MKELNIYYPRKKYKKIITENTIVQDRLKKYSLKTKTGCWIWLQDRNSNGYGRISYKGKMAFAHRVSYQVFNDITLKNIGLNTKDTICVLHLCNNPSCINPKHLVIGTQQLNSDHRRFGISIESLEE